MFRISDIGDNGKYSNSSGLGYASEDETSIGISPTHLHPEPAPDGRVILMMLDSDIAYPTLI
jgi:hypothetical protein